MSDMVEIRTLTTVEVEIVSLQQQAKQLLTMYAIEIGRRLVEAKEMVKHGEWGDWLKKMGYGKSTANNLMRLFDAYGEEQQSLFGAEVKSQTIGNLPYTKALALLGLSEEEREEFAETHDVDGMSTRELEAAIKRRKDAELRADAAEKELAASEKLRAELAEKYEAAAATQAATLDNLAKVKKEAEEAAKKAADAEAAADAAQKKYEKERKACDAARKLLREAKENPKLSEDAMAKIQKDAEDAAAEKNDKKVKRLQEAADKAKQAAEAAQKAADDMKSRAEAAEKKLLLADANLALLQNEAKRLQNSFASCLELLGKIRAANEELGGKMANFLAAVVEGFGKGLEQNA